MRLERSPIEYITHSLIDTNTVQLCLTLSFNMNSYWPTPSTKAYVTPSWIHAPLAFCDSHSIQLIINCASPPIRTVNGRFHMQIFQRHYAGFNLQMLQQCTAFLQVLTMSDIEKVDRLRLSTMLSGQSHFKPRYLLPWLNTPLQLTNQHWYLWSQSIRLHLLQPKIPHLMLRQPKGF